MLKSRAIRYVAINVLDLLDREARGARHGLCVAAWAIEAGAALLDTVTEVPTRCSIVLVVALPAALGLTVSRPLANKACRQELK